MVINIYNSFVKLVSVVQSVSTQRAEGAAEQKYISARTNIWGNKGEHLVIITIFVSIIIIIHCQKKGMALVTAGAVP